MLLALLVLWPVMIVKESDYEQARPVAESTCA